MGQKLNGKVIQNVAFGSEGMNDNGSLAFIAYFADGSMGIYRADPVQ